MTTKLCPSPLNELGKGTLSPQDEARFLTDGYVFAARVPNTRIRTFVVCKRPIVDAVTDGDLDSPLFRKPVPTVLNRHSLAQVNS